MTTIDTPTADFCTIREVHNIVNMDNVPFMPDHLKCIADTLLRIANALEGLERNHGRPKMPPYIPLNNDTF